MARANNAILIQFLLLWKIIENSIKIVWHHVCSLGYFTRIKFLSNLDRLTKNKREREMRKGEREERGRENEMKRFTSHTGSDSLSCFLSQEKETNEGCLQTSYKWSIILADFIKQTLISIIYLSILNAYFWWRWRWNQYRQISIVCHFTTDQMAVEK